MATKTLSVKLTLNIKGFTKKLKIATKQVSVMSKKMGKSMSSLGKSLSLSITLPAGIAGVAMIKLASDADEVNNKFNEIFGRSAPNTAKALEKIATTIGRSSTSLKEFAGDMGGVLSSMGFADDEAGKLSESMIKLGIDVGSFRNKSDDQVINAFTSALVGEREALKSLGVSILESDVKLEAFNLGLAEGKGALTKRAKVLATVSLLQKRFAKDAGDALRTQDGFANVLKKFNSIAKKTGENLGKLILPTITKLLSEVTKIVEVFDKLNDRTKKIGLAIIGLGAVLGPLLVGMGLLFQAVGVISGAFLFLITSIGPVLVAMKLFGAGLLSNVASLFRVVGKAILLMAKRAGILLLKLAPIVIILTSLFVIVQRSIILYGVLQGALANNAKVIVTKLGPALLVLMKAYQRVIKTTVFFQNIGKGFDKATMLAFKATNDITKSINLLEKEINNPKFTGFSDALEKEARQAELKALELAEGMDKALKNTGERAKIAFANGLKGLGNVIKQEGAVFKQGMSGLIDKASDTVKDKFNSLMKDLKDFAFKNPIKIKFEASNGDTSAPFGRITGGASFGASPFGPATSGINPVTTGQPAPPKKPPPPVDLTALQKFAEESEKISERFSEMWAGTFEQFSSGFGDAIASAIVDGQDLGEAMKSMADDMLKTMISSIVKMVTNWVVGQATMMGASASTTAGVVTNNSLQAGSGAAASQAGIPIVGPILALIAMGAMIASVGALSGSIAMASGGITTGPTNALIGEAGQEAVIPLDKLDNMMGAREQTITVELDSSVLTRAVIKNSPKEIRLRSGVIM